MSGFEKITVSDLQQSFLDRIVHQTTAPQRKAKRAKIILIASNDGEIIGTTLSCHLQKAKQLVLTAFK